MLRSRRTGWILGLIAGGLAAVVALMPPAQLEQWPSVCLFRLATGCDCPGCGLTRAVNALCHGELERAMALNWRVLLVVPLAVIAGLKLLFTRHYSKNLLMTLKEMTIGKVRGSCADPGGGSAD